MRPSITAVATNLLFVATPRQVPDTNGGPPQVTHHLLKAAARAGSAAALENFKVVEQGLRAYSLDHL
jgi:hypothetical protein